MARIQYILAYKGTFVVAFLLTLLLSLMIVFGVRAEIERKERVEESLRERIELCQNQHSIIEMQRLFLQEHAAIRVQLENAGIPNQHADPELLKRLEVLINEADCDPSALK